MALRVRGAYYGAHTRIDTRRLVPTSRLLSRITGMAVQRNKAVVGAERLRARVRHPPARHAQAPRHLRNHAPGGRRLGAVADGAGPPQRPRRAERSPAGAGLRAGRGAAELGVRRLQGAGREEARSVRRRPGGAGARRRCARRARPSPGALARQHRRGAGQPADAPACNWSMPTAPRSAKPRSATARCMRCSPRWRAPPALALEIDSYQVSQRHHRRRRAGPGQPDRARRRRRARPARAPAPTSSKPARWRGWTSPTACCARARRHDAAERRTAAIA